MFNCIVSIFFLINNKVLGASCLVLNVVCGFRCVFSQHGYMKNIVHNYNSDWGLFV